MLLIAPLYREIAVQNGYLLRHDENGALYFVKNGYCGRNLRWN